ncbi:hypothetical protein EYF80_005307 [Liparis tanakae]|uniref:Uncharacterized protein n=1 Tax=Liparis tanakae TaxID=230148 RepID=A0A4Z2J394_9TELE|nr:hypothetical protein EYF80_005307 [Liparis tanakae]
MDSSKELSQSNLLLTASLISVMDELANSSLLNLQSNQVKLTAQQLILPLHVPELDLHLQYLPTTSPHRLPQQRRGHPLVVVVVV